MQEATWQTPPWHTPLSQSALLAQVLPSLHEAQARPPQSMSLSSLFLTPSAHVAARQRPPSQTPLWQSPASAQG